MPVVDVTLEWSEIPQDEKKESLSREVLLVAIQNTSLADIKTVLESINMVTKPAEIELFSALRAVTKESDATVSIAVLDLGASISKLYVAESGFLRRLHRVQFGGAFATNTIAKQLNISFEEAENLKRNYIPTQPQASVIKKALETSLERSFEEFKRVISQHELRTGVPINRIVLTGGVASFTDIAQHAAYVFGKEIEIANPFKKIAFPAFLEDTLVTIAPTFSVALGAALRRFEQ